MPHISVLKQSNFLTKADCGQGILVTIKEVFQQNVAKEGASEDLKWCMSFEELEKPMVLNTTNGAITAAITKSEQTEDWTGHKIVLYDEPNVSYGGKLTGGIRVRAPRGKAAAAVKPTPVKAKPAPAPVDPGPEGEDDSQIPF